MQFTYEISADEYVASQMLYYKLRFGWRRLQRAAGWILAGILLIVVVGHEKVLNWAPILLAVIGVWWIYAGVMCLFPGYYFRRAYPGSGVSGKQFRVEADEQGFEVFGDVCSWRVRWSGVEIKGEDKSVFILCSYGTIFMFGKKYLTDEQQSELRTLAALSTADPN